MKTNIITDSHMMYLGLIVWLLMTAGFINTNFVSVSKISSPHYEESMNQLLSNQPMNKAVTFSTRDIILAKIIQERFTHLSPAFSLEIAHDINTDTRGLAWPTPLAVASVIEIESQYKPSAVSDCGATGLMQINPLIAKLLPAPYTTVSGNIKDGVYFLNQLYKLYGNNEMAAILAYNSGPYAYNEGKAWPRYWYRFNSDHLIFDRIFSSVVNH